jgi:hypothetical protein
MARNEIVLAEYRYYVVDILTNSVIAEIPFTSVSYERALSKAGVFSGQIPVIAATQSLDLYESTMPGKTALYVLRNGVCVWGGIIWSRSYSPTDKTLTVDGREWISYLYHRAVWQTLFYGSEGIYCSSYKASAGVATVYTDVAHGFLIGNTVKINSLNTGLNGTHVITDTPSLASFTYATTAGTLALSPSSTGIARTIVNSYDVSRDILGWLADDFGENQFINDAIKPASENEYSIVNKLMVSGLATVTTSLPHDLVEGQLVEIVDVDAALDGYQTITSIPSSTSFSFQVEGSSASISSTAVTGINTYIVTTKATVTNIYTVNNKVATNNIVTLTTSVAHDLAEGDEIAIQLVDTNLNGRYTVASIPSSTTFTYAKTVANIASTPVTGGEMSYKTAVLVTSAAHGLSKNKTVVVEIGDAAYDGTVVVSKVVDGTTFKYNLFSTLNYAPEAVSGGIIKWGGRAVAGTYGSFSGNSDAGIGVTNQVSSKYIGLVQQIFRGSDLRYFGEILEDFSKDINGFEYRIDCDFESEQFTRTFRFVPFIPPPNKVIVTNKQLTSNIATLTTQTAHGLDIGEEIVVTDVGLSFDGTITVESTPTTTTFTYKAYQLNVPSTPCYGYIGLVHPISVLGADQYVFEYPGNILEFKVDESAEDSATRMWVGGNNQGLDGDASQPYAAASSLDLFATGWPVLDQIEASSNDQAGEDMLYDYAEEFLLEARPPEMTFSISVNGSIDPVVGDYLPGDWCSIIIDDDFVRMRLGSDLEPRSDVIVRKIAGYKVSVPDSPAFPEKVDLELISEFKEDRRNAKQT